MTHRWLLYVIACFFWSAQAKTIYTWQDTQGITHFSDIPHPQATTFHLADTQPATKPPAPTGASQHPKRVASTPLELTILSPLNNQAIRSNNGALTIKAKLNRPLDDGETLRLLLNEETVLTPEQSLVWQLRELPRGSHQIQLEAFQYGKLIASSQPITVHLLRITAISVK
ncbi:DUF4124 domain-containing protein [Vibrio sinaloensis]|uniref:DUF4124 domain-containing protein n=1 Tax=Photobacterium sp. (strain ATCC 43367) TaxID=379097 RepID=UPI0020642DD5|nr:DUF4124 domain-containing protein [Vibrio sinaloensis]UPQ88035.1 DUF4124 domain-containing protein [Vibrio sinaloensis]